MLIQMSKFAAEHCPREAGRLVDVVKQGLIPIEQQMHGSVLGLSLMMLQQYCCIMR